MVMKLRFVLLFLCLPAVLAFPRPAGEEGKEEERSEGTDDGELEEEEEEEGEDDELEDKELSPPDHIAGAPLERDGHLNTVSVCLRACVYVCYEYVLCECACVRMLEHVYACLSVCVVYSYVRVCS